MLRPRSNRFEATWPDSQPLLGWWWALAVAAAGGLLGVLAFPRFGIWPLAAVAVAALSVSVQGRRARSGAVLGFVWGLGFFLPLVQWTGIYVGPLPWLILATAEAGYLALLGAALPTLQRQRWAPIWIGAGWVAQEALRSRWPFGGFPWGRWAFSQAESPLRWFAALGGAPLVSFLVALAGGVLARAVIRAWLVARSSPSAAVPQGRSWFRRLAVRRATVATAAAAVAGLALIPVSGLAAGALLRPGPSARTAVVALVQGNVPDRGLEFNARRRQVLDNHVAATLALADRVRHGQVPQPALVVWPENSSDIDPLTNPDAAAQINRAAQAVGAPILVGTILNGPGPTHISNVSIVWSPTTGPGEQYVKRHPVPFAEYIPWRGLARLVSSKVNLVPRDMVAGSGTGLLHTTPFPVGDVICFEVAYDGLVRSSVQAGAQALVVQTNNATFGHTAETYQQLAMSQLRAVETGRTVLPVSTSGVSAVIGADGRIEQRSGALFTRDVLVASIPLRTSFTLATRLGAIPEYLLTAAAVAALLVAFLDRGRARRRGDPAVDGTVDPAKTAAPAGMIGART